VEHLLGTGGASTVFLARDRRRDRDVALKVLRPELAASIQAERFLREIDITRSLRHTNIPPLYDAGQMPSPPALGGEYLYLAVPFVQGDALDWRLDRDGQMPVQDAIRITVAVASALQHAHDVGVIHRDVKPGNIFLSADGRILMSDFGMARAIDSKSDRLTQSGYSIGTPVYMSPEQVTGERADAPSDQNSLASILYEMLTGRPPFTGGSTQTVLMRRLAEAAPSMRAARPSVP
jgi:serine/threonine-protein kinase